MQEWLETNGIGGYAAGTVEGANTRRYHGLLVASLEPPVDRRVLVSRIDECVVDNSDDCCPLSASIFKGQPAIPVRCTLLDGFDVLPVPTWHYQLPHTHGLLTKQMTLVPGENTLAVAYRLSKDSQPVQLKVRPFLVDRDFHSLSNAPSPWAITKTPPHLAFSSPVAPERALYWYWDQPDDLAFTEDAQAYWHYWYPLETDRGLEDEEALWTPGYFLISLQPGQCITLFAGLKAPLEQGVDNMDALLAARERVNWLPSAKALAPQIDAAPLLFRAASQCVVERASTHSPTVIAGYPWFNDWGRDTMIALPGLTLATCQAHLAEGILKTFSQLVQNGLLPNNLPDAAGNTPGYNTLDASLWWFHAVYCYAQTVSEERSESQRAFLTQQYQALRAVWFQHLYGRHSGASLLANNPALTGIIAPSQGKLPVGSGQDGIGMETDGLLAADNPQLTWMDAARGPEAFTPRRGKPVEINALWYHAQFVLMDLASRLMPEDPKAAAAHQDDMARYSALAKIIQSQLQRYWLPERGYLLDLLDSPESDTAIRPNMLLAISLPHRAFSQEQARQILDVIDAHLLTPYGLRTLSPHDKRYAGHYPLAGPEARDRVYHQGTVWPWLIGPYLDAYYYVYGQTPEAKEHAWHCLEPLLNHLKGHIATHNDSGACLGGISEIFDGQWPHYAKGCPQQAWSVAEVLRHALNAQPSATRKKGQPTTRRYATRKQAVYATGER